MANIEVFIAGTYLCEDIVKQVNELACSKCDVVIYDLHQSSATAEWIDIAKRSVCTLCCLEWKTVRC